MHARAKNPIPKGWAFVAERNPTTDPEAALKGSMAPIGGYKGFGNDRGFQWYRTGKLKHKINTFLDFISAAETLIERKLTSKGRIVTHGGSAGGMLVGAVINMRPDLFGAAVAEVPFVDVLNTMSDETLPLTPPEWVEWGNPITDADACRRMRSYSPYDNVSAQAYPPILATAGISDPRVTYWEPANRGQRWIERVGPSGYETYYTPQLSGGMQQRVRLARALATDAEILLMDEPFSALDPSIRTDMQEILLGLQTELHKTIIFITHDLDEALRLGNSIAILRNGEVIQIGTAQQIVMNPVDDYIADFIKEINCSRVIQVSSIMDNGVFSRVPEIDGDMVLEDALQIVSNSGSAVATVTMGGQSVGSVRLDTMISALSRNV